MLSRLRASRLLRVLLAVIALAFCGYGLATQWDSTRAALAQLSWWSVAGTFAALMAGLGCMLVAWRDILAGLGSPLPLRVASRVLFVGQLAKYIPGSVWSFAAMAELGRDHKATARGIFAATVLGLATSLACALALAAATLPLVSGAAAADYAWMMALAPVVLVCLHPRIVGFFLNLLFRILRREPLPLPTVRTMARAAAWTMLGWLLYGVHLWLLLADVRDGGWGLYLVAAGAYGLAWSTGILTVVIPAGIGVREGAMVLALTPVLDPGRALAIAIVSRVAFTLADVAWAGLGFVLGRARRAAPESPADSESPVPTAS
ncbi:lysylphosphatidylglycerol synthase domain-containing protein [Bailinhaonella thermotolerans]|uniref:UPF0104 family protein n=1 Tax=Bailinhaonella thermotolerans TaxID=1070861 RepID=A0A3A4AT65_9ACTN|nr:lysylphosphatidylglycerol synthase domain-containing protein [Bailinhaonella thermotolerans]RJL30494.1 UPF0104 family protein [Bailinhaonella thermotolerans]